MHAPFLPCHSRVEQIVGIREMDGWHWHSSLQCWFLTSANESRCSCLWRDSSSNSSCLTRAAPSSSTSLRSEPAKASNLVVEDSASDILSSLLTIRLDPRVESGSATECATDCVQPTDSRVPACTQAVGVTCPRSARARARGQGRRTRQLFCAYLRALLQESAFALGRDLRVLRHSEVRHDFQSA